MELLESVCKDHDMGEGWTRQVRKPRVKLPTVFEACIHETKHKVNLCLFYSLYKKRPLYYHTKFTSQSLPPPQHTPPIIHIFHPPFSHLKETISHTVHIYNKTITVFMDLLHQERQIKKKTGRSGCSHEAVT